MSEKDDYDWTTDDIQDLCTMPWHEDLDYGYDKEVARFERWLESVKAEAWHKGFCKGEQSGVSEIPLNPYKWNPYRKGNKN